MAHSIEIRAGRLLEVSLGGTLDVEEVAELMDALDAAIGKATFVPVIVVSDWRWLHLMSHEASEQLLTRIKRANPWIARAAALASSASPVAALQFARLLQATNHATRRLFYDPDALVDWLGQILMEPEIERLHEVVGAWLGAADLGHAPPDGRGGQTAVGPLNARFHPRGIL